jgi:hypothetical protein
VAAVCQSEDRAWTSRTIDQPRRRPTSPLSSAREIEHQRKRERQAAEAAALARLTHPTGGGCAWCGISWSNTDHPKPWTSLDGQLLCLGCWNEHCINDPLTDSSDDRRVRRVAALLGLDGLPLLAVGNSSAFAGVRVWFDQHPDAVPVSDHADRWRHVDVDQLRAEWDRVNRGYHGQFLGPSVAGPELPLPPTRRGKKCPECGGRDYLVTTDMPVLSAARRN